MPRKRFAGLDEIARGLKQFLFAERVHAIVKRADAGQNHRSRITNLIWPLRDAHICADFDQRLMDAGQITGTVIE